MVTVIKKKHKMSFAPVMGHLFLQKKLFINTSSTGTVSVPKCQAWFPAPDVSLHAPGVWEPPASLPAPGHPSRRHLHACSLCQTAAAHLLSLTSAIIFSVRDLRL